MKNILVTAFIVVWFASCKSTKITSSWREPSKELKISNLKKVLVIALFKNKTTSHLAEDEMVRYLNGKGIVSYTYLFESFNKKNEDAVRTKIKNDGFDGAITMRLLDVDKETSYTRGRIDSYPDYYRSFTGYYLNSMSYYNEPNYYTTTKIYKVETNVYSIKDDKIIWTGLTETTNPEGVDKMTKEITKVVFKQMIKEGFIQE